jgi:hypothetical protein
MASAMSGRGNPHVPPVTLPRDARGRERWLAFVGTPDVALGAWHVTRAADGTLEADPVARWPAGVRVVGDVVQDGVAYVILESLGVLDQPAGLRATWIDAAGRSSPFEASPLTLAGVEDAAALDTRLKQPPAVGSSERSAAALLGTLRAASASSTALARTFASEGVDLGLAWQSLFVQPVSHLDAGSSPSPQTARLLSIVRAAAATQACGADACEAWTARGRAVLRFVVQGGRWVLRAVIEDAPLTRAPGGASQHEVDESPDASATQSLLRARAREARQVLGQAPLTSTGGTIGVALTDLAPDSPTVAVREGQAERLFVLPAGAVRAESAGSARWEAAFADVDGDGRTDVVVRFTGERRGGGRLAWTQTFLAPPPSVQATALEADLPSALAAMDAPDVRSAAHAAASLPLRGVSRDDACRLLSGASTPAGFKKVAAADARLLLFEDPGLPTWHPRVVPLAKIAADDVRGLGAHCAEMTCAAARPYCAWEGGSDSQHAWFGWQDGKLVIVGAADYQGE